jgi:hypothetical protein
MILHSLFHAEITTVKDLPIRSMVNTVKLAACLPPNYLFRASQVSGFSCPNLLSLDKMNELPQIGRIINRILAIKMNKHYTVIAIMFWSLIYNLFEITKI